MENQWIVFESWLEEGDPRDRWNRIPNQKILSQVVDNIPMCEVSELTLRSRRMLGSEWSPSKNFNASGECNTSLGLERTNFPTSADMESICLNRSAKWMAIAGSISHAVRMAFVQTLYKRILRVNLEGAEKVVRTSESVLSPVGM